MWVRSPGILVTWRPPFLGEGGSCSQSHPPKGVLQPPKAPISVSLSPIKRAPTFFTSNSNKHWVTSFTLSSRHQILLNIAQQAQKNARTVTLLGGVTDWEACQERIIGSGSRQKWRPGTTFLLSFKSQPDPGGRRPGEAFRGNQGGPRFSFYA